MSKLAGTFRNKSDCLQEFFNFLERHGVGYCVVGDSSQMPTEVPSDIDIVVDARSLCRIGALVRDFCLTYDLSHVQTLRHEQTAYYYVIAFYDQSGSLKFLHPDICSDYFRNGRKLLNAEEMLSNRVLAVDKNGSGKGFFVAKSHQEFIYYFIKKIDKGSLSSDQFDHLREQYLLAVEESNEMLMRFWSEVSVAEISSSLLRGDMEALRRKIPDLKRELAAGKQFNLTHYAREFCRKVGRALRPTGVSVALLGPDGAGKTAVGEGLVEVLSPAFRNVSRFHLRPYCIGKPGSRHAVIDPHAKKPRGKIGSTVKLAYFAADYILGSVWKVLPLKIRSNLVVFDRYYHDLLVDPKRYRYSAPRWLSRLVSKFMPTPDLFIVLDAPAGLIQLRKKEVPQAETERQRRAYLEFSDSRGDCLVLDTSKPLEFTIHEGCKAILEYMQIRELKRQRVA